jgi:hypothetical protein
MNPALLDKSRDPFSWRAARALAAQQIYNLP